MIHSNTDRRGELRADLGSFQFGQREAPPESNLGVVLLRLAPDQGSELVRGPRRVRRGFGGALEPPRLLLARLVEPGLDVEGPAARRLPLLVEVLVGDDLVVLDHLGFCVSLAMSSFATQRRRGWQRAGSRSYFIRLGDS